MAESDCPHCKKLLRIIEKEEISYNRCLESPNAAKVLCYDCNLYLCSKCNTSHPCTHKILYIDTTPALEIPQQVIECCGEPWGIAINKNGSKWAVADNSNHRIYIYNGSDHYLQSVGCKGDGIGELNTPKG